MKDFEQQLRQLFASVDGISVVDERWNIGGGKGGNYDYWYDFEFGNSNQEPRPFTVGLGENILNRLEDALGKDDQLPDVITFKERLEDILFEEADKAFESQGVSTGAKFAPLSEVTIEKKRAAGYAKRPEMALVETGQLITSLRI